MLTVLCVRFGNKYGIEYVERLRNMVSRNLSIPYEFVCLTDNSTPIEGVRLIVQKPGPYQKLWWHKVHMFDPELNIQGRILYFDLDVVICGNITKLTEGKNFLGIQDFNRKFHANWQYLNSSVMCWNHGEESIIWESFKNNMSNAQRMHGDQDWIWHINKKRISFWPKEWIQSYKWEIRSRDELIVRTGQRGFKQIKNIQPPLGCCVAVFHGDPKPEDVKDSLVVDNWK